MGMGRVPIGFDVVVAGPHPNHALQSNLNFLLGVSTEVQFDSPERSLRVPAGAPEGVRR